jgi:hypothetical protein
MLPLEEVILPNSQHTVRRPASILRNNLPTALLLPASSHMEVMGNLRHRTTPRDSNRTVHLPLSRAILLSKVIRLSRAILLSKAILLNKVILLSNSHMEEHHHHNLGMVHHHRSSIPHKRVAIQPSHTVHHRTIRQLHQVWDMGLLRILRGTGLLMQKDCVRL